MEALIPVVAGSVIGLFMMFGVPLLAKGIRKAFGLKEPEKKQ